MVVSEALPQDLLARGPALYKLEGAGSINTVKAFKKA